MRQLMRAMVGLVTAMALFSAAYAATVDGVWTGSYVCPQGRTPLTLFVMSDLDGTPTSYFHFGGAGTTLPEGCYTMQGSLTGNRMSFTAMDWLLRPAGYVTVDLTGTLTGDRYAGIVAGPGCTSFTLARTGPAPLPDACRKHGAIS